MPRAERPKADGHSRVITVNRRAYHDYDILETVEAGLVLTGTEIKSLRAAQVDIQHAFARVEGGEVWLFNAHISQYPQGNIYNHDPIRPRKLLLHAREIGELAGTAAQKGLTLIPLRVYIKGHVAKVQIGLARGRKLYDKRQAIIEKEQEREIGRTVRSAPGANRPMGKGCVEGLRSSARSLRVSLRYKLRPLPGQEGGQGDGPKSFSTPC